MSRSLALLALIAATPAAAAELRDYCPLRPGLGTSACTVDPGHVSLEVSAVDLTHDRNRDGTTDTTLAGDFVARLGVDRSTEIQLGWTPFGHEREHDRATGTTTRASRTGDVTLALRRNLADPDGAGLSAAVQSFVSLPVGRTPIGAGDWGAGLVLPVTYEVGKSVQIELTSVARAAPDEDGDGRHFAGSLTGGVAYKLSEAVTAQVELQAARDDDPMGHETEWLSALSLAWQPGKNLQFDVEADAGLNRSAPDIELLAGIAARF